MNTKFGRILTRTGMACGIALACATAAGATELKATLSGANETAGGDVDGSGAFKADVDVDTGDVCYTLAVSKIGEVKAAHIHAGLAGKDGGPVVAISVTGPVDDLCMAMEPEKLKEIIDAPGAFYVNVHTGDFPSGAIRGQFDGPTGKAVEEPAPVADGSAAAPVDAPAEAAAAQ